MSGGKVAKSATAFRLDGGAREVDAACLVVPSASSAARAGAAAAPRTVQPKTDKVLVAEANDELLRLSRSEHEDAGGAQQAPRRTLLEQHQEGLQKRKRPKSGPVKAEKPKEDWEGEHPWRPFDREKDMLGGRAQGPPGMGLGGASGSLSSRFHKGLS